MNIYLVRHGDDDERYRGGWSELPLVEAGIDKAKKLGEYLSSEKNYEIKVDRIISSDLKRVKMTADIINEKLNVSILYDKRLRENNNGALAGMLNEEAIKKYPHAFFSTLKYNERFPNNIYIDDYDSILSSGKTVGKKSAYINVKDIITFTNNDLSDAGTWKGHISAEFEDFLNSCIQNYNQDQNKNKDVYWI